MAETQIKLRRGSSLEPIWFQAINSLPTSTSPDIALHSISHFTWNNYTTLLADAQPWFRTFRGGGQLFVDGICINPVLINGEGIRFQTILNPTEYVIQTRCNVAYDPQTLLINSDNQLAVNVNAIALQQTPLFTASVQGSVQPWLSAVTGLDHNDFHWLGESNVWHTFGVLEIDGSMTVNNYNSIKYQPTGNWHLTFNKSFYLDNYGDDMYWTKVQLNAASTTLLAGIKLSCPHTLNASIPTIFGNQFYPIGKNNNDQIFTVIPRATSLSSGVVTVFGNNSGIAIGESTILTDDVNFEDDNLHTILDETHAYRAFIFNSKVSKYHSLSITITPETIATEYHIVLDNRNNNNLCQIDDIVFNGTDLQNLEIFLPKTTSMTIPANEWRLISIKVVKHATQDATYVFITN